MDSTQIKTLPTHLDRLGAAQAVCALLAVSAVVALWPHTEALGTVARYIVRSLLSAVVVLALAELTTGRRHCFSPLKRRGAVLALTGTFMASAVLHAYVFITVDLIVALTWAAFFLAQPPLLLAERRLRVRFLAAWLGPNMDNSSPCFTSSAASIAISKCLQNLAVTR